MSSFLSTNRGRSWLFQVTVLCLILGALLGLSLKAQKRAMLIGRPNDPVFAAFKRSIEGENVKLRAELAKAKKTIEDYEIRKNPGNNYQESLENSKLFAGLVNVEGQGVVVTLRDSPLLPKNEMDVQVKEQYMVHDTDIRTVVTELFGAGAEAVSINQNRIVTNTAIRCVGNNVLINFKNEVPPYTIVAIGNASNLESALKMPGGVADQLSAFNMIDIEKSKNLVVPAYDGPTKFYFAKEVK